MSNRCGDCKHFEAEPHTPGGHCKRYPPNFMLQRSNQITGKPEFTFIPPFVNKEGHCGEFAKKLEVVTQ